MLNKMGNETIGGGNKKWMIVGVVVVLAIGAFLFFSFRGGDDVTGKVIVEGEVRPFLITGTDWAPLEYEEDGELKGIEIEIVQEAMDSLGVPYEIDLVPWSRALKMMEVGEADAILGITHNKDREAFLVFTPDQIRWGETGEMPSNYTYILANRFFIRKLHEGVLKYESYEQMAEDGYRVGFNQGYSYPEARASDMNIIDYVSPEDSLKALVAGEIDVYALAEPVGFFAAKKLGILDEITTLSNPHFEKPYLVPISKKSTYPNAEEIMYAYYDEVEKMRQDGRFQAIWDKYTT
jgi:polar amino acid transport system substrate-binding protein